MSSGAAVGFVAGLVADSGVGDPASGMGAGVSVVAARVAVRDGCGGVVAVSSGDADA